MIVILKYLLPYVPTWIALSLHFLGLPSLWHQNKEVLEDHPKDLTAKQEICMSGTVKILTEKKQNKKRFFAGCCIHMRRASPRLQSLNK